MVSAKRPQRNGSSAIGFFVPAQPRIADRFDDQSEDLMHAYGARLCGGRGVDPRKKVHIPRAAQTRAFGKDRSARAHQPVRALFGHEQGDAQPRFLARDAL